MHRSSAIGSVTPEIPDRRSAPTRYSYGLAKTFWPAHQIIPENFVLETCCTPLLLGLLVFLFSRNTYHTDTLNYHFYRPTLFEITVIGCLRDTKRAQKPTQMASTVAETQSSSYNESTPLLKDGNDPNLESQARSGNAPTNTSSSPENQNADDDLPQELSLAKLCIVLLAAWVGVFLGAVDTTVITTLLAPISTSFSSFKSISWIATGYLIANAALQPLFGKLTDIYGRKPVLVLCNILFGVGTLMCGLAKNQYSMIFGRVIAGAGGGGLMTISSIIATDLVPLRKRGVAQGGGNIAYGAGAALGGVYGGFIHDWIGWRWAFLLQIPFIIVSAALVLAFVKIPVKKTEEARYQRIDYLGSGTLLCSLVTLLLALNTGGNTLPWTHPLVMTCLPLSVVLLGAFSMVELWYAKEPVIPVRLLGNRTVLAVCLTNWFMVMSVFSVVRWLLPT